MEKELPGVHLLNFVFVVVFVVLISAELLLRVVVILLKDTLGHRHQPHLQFKFLSLGIVFLVDARTMILHYF